ncbi:MAG: hypothetical protein ACTSPV_01245 [Candidatus Hodarchaeales archaeon]
MKNKRKFKCEFCGEEVAVGWYHAKRICQRCWNKIKYRIGFFKHV